MVLVKSLEFAVFFLLLKPVVTESRLQVTISTNDKVKDAQIHRKIGQTLSLNCSISGPNKKTQVLIEWLKNGKQLSSSNTTDGWFVKKISNMSLSHGGYYKCQATYNKDTQSAGVFVNFEGKPQILQCCDFITSNPVYVSFGSDQLLKCTATGWPLPNLKWFKNGKELKKEIGEKEGTYKLKSVANGLNLVMLEMTKKEEGSYTCHASNIYGRDTYKNIVRVLDPPTKDPVVEATNSHVLATIGQNNITLACIGNGAPELESDTEWFHNGKELDEDNNNSRRHLAFNTTYYGADEKVKMQLTIFNITKADSGSYACIVYVNDKTVNDTILLTVAKKESNKSDRGDDPKMMLKVVIPVAVSVFILVVVVSSLVCYKCRNKADPPKIPKGPFRYGAFITYSSHDYPWVKANLLSFLNENGIETCIHYRNFEAGELLEQNIVNCIYRSRVVIAVISKNYMKSKYCCSELEYAIHRSIEEPGFNPLIALKIDESVKRKKLPLGIRRKTFLDVTSEVEKDTWKQRLLMHLKGKEDDQNQNVLNGEIKQNNPGDDVHVPLMDPEQERENACCA